MRTPSIRPFAMLDPILLVAAPRGPSYTTGMPKRSPGYKDGLSFACTQCGNCCTGAPGVVWVTEEELSKIAEVRGETIEEVRAQHTRQIEGRVSLTERENGD